MSVVHVCDHLLMTIGYIKAFPRSCTDFVRSASQGCFKQHACLFLQRNSGWRSYASSCFTAQINAFGQLFGACKCTSRVSWLPLFSWSQRPQTRDALAQWSLNRQLFLRSCMSCSCSNRWRFTDPALSNSRKGCQSRTEPPIPSQTDTPSAPTSDAPEPPAPTVAQSKPGPGSVDNGTQENSDDDFEGFDSDDDFAGFDSDEEDGTTQSGGSKRPCYTLVCVLACRFCCFVTVVCCNCMCSGSHVYPGAKAATAPAAAVIQKLKALLQPLALKETTPVLELSSSPYVTSVIWKFLERALLKRHWLHAVDDEGEDRHHVELIRFLIAPFAPLAQFC